MGWNPCCCGSGCCGVCREKAAETGEQFSLVLEIGGLAGTFSVSPFTCDIVGSTSDIADLNGVPFTASLVCNTTQDLSCVGIPLEDYLSGLGGGDTLYPDGTDPNTNPNYPGVPNIPKACQGGTTISCSGSSGGASSSFELVLFVYLLRTTGGRRFMVVTARQTDADNDGAFGVHGGTVLLVGFVDLGTSNITCDEHEEVVTLTKSDGEWTIGEPPTETTFYCNAPGGDADMVTTPITSVTVTLLKA